MRGREFLMKDAYSFDLDYAGAVVSYRKMMLAYMRTFQRMGLKAIPMAADTGPIGGDLSHEFIILAPTGESQVFYDAAFEEIDYGSVRAFDAEQPEPISSGSSTLMTTHYAATDEKHDAAAWEKVAPAAGARAGASKSATSSISAPNTARRWASRSPAPDGKPVVPEMGSYGIGVSRLVGAVIEASHDEAGIIWPDSVAPFRAAILNLKPGDAGLRPHLRSSSTASFGGDALYDDRDDRPGVKFADADLMGHPWQIVVGPRGAAAGKVELKRRATGERQEVSARGRRSRAFV